MVDAPSPARSLDPVSRVFHALADPTRRSILERLAEGGPRSIGEIAAPFKVSLQAISKHLKVLERAGLISRDVEGRVHRCSLDAAPMARASTWIERYRPFWEDQLSALERYLDETADENQGAEGQPPSTRPAPKNKNKEKTQDKDKENER